MLEPELEQDSEQLVELELASLVESVQALVLLAMLDKTQLVMSVLVLLALAMLVNNSLPELMPTSKEAQADQSKLPQKLMLVPNNTKVPP